MDYKGWNDYELIYLFKEGSPEAYNLMFRKYKTFIISVARKCGVRFESLDDYLQEGLIMLDKSLKTYNESLNKTFTKYFELVVMRRFWRLRSKDVYYDKLENDLVSTPSFKEVITEYKTCVKDKEDQDLLIEYFYYHTSIAELSKKYKISKTSIYKRLNKIKQNLAIEFDIYPKR